MLFRALLFAALTVLAAPSAGFAEAPATPAVPRPDLTAVLERAESLAPLRTLIVGRAGTVLVEEGFHGGSPARATNIKSASKSVVAALVGIAIEKGVLAGVDQRVAPLLADGLPADPDPRLGQVTVGNLLSMQAGLERTSGPNYGRWIASRDWVRAALAQRFVAEPGGEMLYSTGSSHLLSAILTKASGRSTLKLARDWLGPAGVEIASWERDPQGIYLGGNQMAMTPRALYRFGELYRRGGRTADGRQVVPESWVRESWVKRTTTRWSGDSYGYGWFGMRLAGHDVHYGWGYGGQMIYVVPDLALTITMTSDDGSPSARTGYKDALHGLVAEIIAATQGRPAPASPPAAAGRTPDDPAG